MYVCLCRGISDKQIRELIAKGVVRLRDLQRQCRVGADCGSCLFQVREMLAQDGNEGVTALATTRTSRSTD